MRRQRHDVYRCALAHGHFHPLLAPAIRRYSQTLNSYGLRPRFRVIPRRGAEIGAAKAAGHFRYDSALFRALRHTFLNGYAF